MTRIIAICLIVFFCKSSLAQHSIYPADQPDIVNIWHRVADGTLIWEKKVESEEECITFSPDGSLAATGDEAYMVRLWDVKSSEELHSWEHQSGIDGIAWSHDGKTLAAGTGDGLVVLYDPESRQKKGAIKVGSTVNSLQFTPDNKHLLVGGNIQTKNEQSGQTDYSGFAKLIDLSDDC